MQRKFYDATIKGIHTITPCLCGHRCCNDWHVSPSAEVQGVSFTREEADIVASALNFAERNHTRGGFVTHLSAYDTGI